MIALKKWTVDELLGMEQAGLLDPEKRVELIDGEVYELAIGEDHAEDVYRDPQGEEYLTRSVARAGQAVAPLAFPEHKIGLL